jgi:outer membrane protein assembly factor BamB
VAALDAATGAVVWRTPVQAPIHGAPTVAGGRVFVVTTDNEIISLDAATGAVSWTHQALVEPARFAIASSPAVSGDVVVAPFSSGELIALRAQNGNELWNDVLSRSSRNNALSEIRDIAGRPAIYRGDVFATSHSGVFSATDLRTGQRRWTVPLTGLTTPWPAGDWSGPLLASNRLVLVNTEGEAVAADARTGAVQRTLRLGSPAFITPIAAGGMIYVVTEQGELVAIR